MQRLAILAPALLPAAYMIAMLAVYALRRPGARPPEAEASGERRASALFGPFLSHYFVWLLQPLLRIGLALKISPNALTLTSLALCALSGIAIAHAYLATAAWLYVAAGALDILDGRLARAAGRQTRAGAFLDSVADRWGELFVLSAFAWYLRESAWQAAAVFAIAGSVMVSYTRARGEGVGIRLEGGAMQRAERVALVAAATLVAAWFEAGPQTAAYGPHVIGAALAVIGVGAAATAASRGYRGYRRLLDLDRRDPRTTGDGEAEAPGAGGDESERGETRVGGRGEGAARAC